MLRKLFLFIILLIVLLLATMVAGVYMAAEETPLLANNRALQQQELELVRQIVSQNKIGEVLKTNRKSVQLSTVQLNEVALFAAHKIDPKIRIQITPGKDRFRLIAVIELPGNPAGKYLNVDLTARIQYSKYFVVESLKLGRVPVPATVITMLQPLVVNEITRHYGDYVSLWQYLRRIDMTQESTTVFYRLERSDLADVAEKGRRLLINQQTRDRLAAYSSRMRQILSATGTGNHSLVNLLGPMFSYIVERSEKSSQFVEENRAALLIMGSYMAGKNPDKLVDGKDTEAMPVVKYTLHQREDLARHYLVSAAINAVAGSKLAHAIGLEKELSDSTGTSGFSFVDLMADIAGNKLAQVALDKRYAAALQQKMKLIDNESLIIGRIEGLPEDMSEQDFRIEYGTTNSDEYIRVVREIERRLYRAQAYRTE